MRGVYGTHALALTELISWQSRGPSVWHSRLLPRRTAAGWMAVWGAVTVALCSAEGGIDYVHLGSCTASRSSGGRRLMEPCDRDELALKRLLRGGRRGCCRDRWVQIDRRDRWSLSHVSLCTWWFRDLFASPFFMSAIIKAWLHKNLAFLQQSESIPMGGKVNLHNFFMSNLTLVNFDPGISIVDQ